MKPIRTYRIEATVVSQLPAKVVYHISADSEEQAIEEIKINGEQLVPSEIDFRYSKPMFYDFNVTNSFIETYDYDWDIGTNDRHS